MLLIPISTLAGATVVFTVVLVVVRKEQRQGRRLFLVTVRGWLDRGCELIARACYRVVQVIGISGMYLVHHFRAALARAIAPRPRRKRTEEKIVFERSDSHLSAMHDHKSDTALTEAQKRKLREKKLEERL